MTDLGEASGHSYVAMVLVSTDDTDLRAVGTQNKLALHINGAVECFLKASVGL